MCVESSYSVSALFSYLSIKMDQGTHLNPRWGGYSDMIYNEHVG